MCAGLVCLAAVHGAAGNGLLQTPPNASQLAHCPTSCGDVEISYPFGIGPGCFRQGFEVICDHTDHPPRLLLGNSTDTYNRFWKTPIEGVVINGGNSLYVVGCNVEVYMFGDNMTDVIGSCISICTDNMETMERAGNVGGNCGGIGCCKIDLEREVPMFTINLARINSTRAEQDKVLSKVKIFLSDDSYQFAVSDLFLSWVNTSNTYHDVTSVFDFAITDQPNCERAQLN
ncbi:hypothetical protein PVAP13_1KG393110 [Panicum virgatum]|uniref:Wall-associated receptor kinase galacturonan-binding domain-containing protein n=1 Tax=Panicum virgatum TaxID=38727 RepID=A0A8T0XJE6_PANVG|nr:hypothetical protein PVAP13_1KG393110 [Panicum virgatum]